MIGAIHLPPRLEWEDLTATQKEVVRTHRAIWHEPVLSAAQSKWLLKQLELSPARRRAAEGGVSAAKWRRIVGCN